MKDFYVSGNAFIFLFGPRLTFRNSSRFEPFIDVNFGGMRLGLTCNNDVANLCAGNPSSSTTAFAMTAGAGFDIKVKKKVGLRLVRADYLYTHFGNGCSLPVCSGNEQNRFRLKSGIVIGWGEALSSLCQLCAVFNESTRVGAVEAVHGGAEVLEVAWARNYDLLVLDIMLPGYTRDERSPPYSG